jgi:hypothetical protein
MTLAQQIAQDWYKAQDVTDRHPTTIDAAVWTVAGTGEFNGDGKSDILLTNTGTGQVVVWLIDATTTPPSVIGGGSPGGATSPPGCCKARMPIDQTNT